MPQTCPITALAVALALQTTPSISLLPHLPQTTANVLETYGPLIPLDAVLAGATVDRNLLDEDAGQVLKTEEDSGRPQA